VKKRFDNSYTTTIAFTGSEGYYTRSSSVATSCILGSGNDFLEIYSDGSNWRIVNCKIVYSVTWDLTGQTQNGSTATDRSCTVTGVLSTDEVVLVKQTAQPSGIITSITGAGAGVINVRFANITGANIALGSGTYRFVINR
jgi:hypothetical protein